MVSKDDEVLVQVSGGSELALYPCLNIIGGIQPRGLNEVMDGDMSDIVIVADIGIADIEVLDIVIPTVVSIAIVPVDI